MSTIFAAALLLCLEGEARCVLNDEGPVGRVYICGLPVNPEGETLNFGFNGFSGSYAVSIAPECRDA